MSGHVSFSAVEKSDHLHRMSDFRLPDRVAFAFHELPVVTGMPASFWSAQHAAGNITIRSGGGHEIVLKSDVERVLASLPSKTFVSREDRAAALAAEAVAKRQKGREIVQQLRAGETRDPQRERGRQLALAVKGKKKEKTS